MNSESYPVVVFPEGWNEQLEDEMNWRGWLDTYVVTQDGVRYALSFYDPVRLKQDLDSYVELGEPCLAEPALILLPELTVPAIQQAVQFLWKQNFFSRLQPCEDA